jgi:hypothetical protein
MGRYAITVTMTEVRTHIQACTAHTLTDDMFKLYLRGFKRRIVNEGVYSRQAVEKAIKNGRMSLPMAQMFADYCLRNA